MKTKKRMCYVFLISLIFMLSTIIEAKDVRREVKIPEVPGYKMIKCDLHTHTVFSDGNVWPATRVKEAWLDGLDAIALTDHIEYKPHKEDVSVDPNRPMGNVQQTAKRFGIMVIKGAEITRDMPPGHINAIFLKDASLLKVDKWEDSVKAAYDQGAFIFWNHPGWKAQQKDGIAKWYEQHENLYKTGQLMGMEIVNGDEYYPEVLKWCNEKKLTPLANTDIHDPIAMDYNSGTQNHRPMNLVLAKEFTPESLKEALLAGRNVVYSENTLYGKEEYLVQIFDNSIVLKNPTLETIGKEKVNFQIYNTSDLTYDLVLDSKPEGFSAPENVTLQREKTALFPVGCTKKDFTGKETVEFTYKVKNLIPAPEQNAIVKIIVTLKVQKEEEKKEDEKK